MLVSTCRMKLKQSVRSGQLSLMHLQQRRTGLRAQRGEGKLKGIIVTAILVFGIYAAFKLVPPYSAECQLNDKIQEIARFGVVDRKTEDQIRDSVLKTIQDLDIPATRENIKVTSKDRKSTRLNSSHLVISYAVFCLKKKKLHDIPTSSIHPYPRILLLAA